MPSGTVEIPGDIPQLPVPKPTLTPRTAPYASSQHSNKSHKKEPAPLTYTSAHPDFTDASSVHGSQVTGKGFRPDGGFGPRYQGISRLRGISMASFYGGPDLHILPSLRKQKLLRNQQMLPQISVVQATKHVRSSQKREMAPDLSQRGTPQPINVKRVEVSLHQVHARTKAPRASPTSLPHEDHENFATKVEITKNSPQKDIKNIPLKSVDLNKGLNVAAAIRRRARENSKKRVMSLEKTFAAKEDTHVMPLSYLPLKEVYLKPETGNNKRQAEKQQHDKTIRILRWLKELKYLDENAVQRGRQEVERTKFQLPDIKEPAITGYL